MNTISPWNSHEFETLLENPQLTDEEMSGKLKTRSVGAIGLVHSFIHNFHSGGNISGLSKLMIHRLE